jgi:hypothetical protein
MTIGITSLISTSGRTTPAAWARASSGSPAAHSAVRLALNSAASRSR